MVEASTAKIVTDIASTEKWLADNGIAFKVSAPLCVTAAVDRPP